MRILSPAKSTLRRFVRFFAARSATRSWLNRRYLRLGYRGMERFYHAFVFIFRGNDHGAEPGEWRVRFADRIIRAPLGTTSFGLDWINALSIVGHDIVIKQTYENVISSRLRPDLFIDVGTNYGTHSLLFLAHDIAAISFEPNPSCHDYLRRTCALNGWKERIEGFAVGKQPGTIELRYPENETWLGSTDPAVLKELEATHKLTSHTVKIVRLDDYMADFEDRRPFLKIDVEGKEADVLRGGETLLRKCRPLVQFESWPGPNRAELLEIFTSLDYKIMRLPWHPSQTDASISREPFINDSDPNFMAVPREVVAT